MKVRKLKALVEGRVSNGADALIYGDLNQAATVDKGPRVDFTNPVKGEGIHKVAPLKGTIANAACSHIDGDLGKTATALKGMGDNPQILLPCDGEGLKGGAPCKGGGLNGVDPACDGDRGGEAIEALENVALTQNALGEDKVGELS